MNKESHCLIALITLTITSVFSQTETSFKKNNLKFSIGYNIGALKNLEFAPESRYDYNGLVYMLNYERSRIKKNFIEIQLSYLESRLESDLIPTLNSDYSKTELYFSYLKQIHDKNAWSLQLGLQSQLALSTYSNDYYVAEQEFGIVSRFKYQLSDKQSLRSEVAFPIALLRITRNTDFTVNTLDSYQSVLWNIEYAYSLSNNIDLKLNYNFKYSRLQISDAFRELQHLINLGINYKF